MTRYHVHGTVTLADGIELAITVSCDADSDDHAQRLAWRAVADLDVQEIERAQCRWPECSCTRDDTGIPQCECEVLT